MTLSADDPRLSAWILGELSDEDAHVVEAAVSASPELQAEVELLRESIHLLEEAFELPVEGAEAFSREHQAAVTAWSPPAPKPWDPFRLATALTAMLAMVIGVVWWNQQPRNASAQNETEIASTFRSSGEAFPPVQEMNRLDQEAFLKAGSGTPFKKHEGTVKENTAPASSSAFVADAVNAPLPATHTSLELKKKASRSPERPVDERSNTDGIAAEADASRHDSLHATVQRPRFVSRDEKGAETVVPGKERLLILDLREYPSRPQGEIRLGTLPDGVRRLPGPADSPLMYFAVDSLLAEGTLTFERDPGSETNVWNLSLKAKGL